MASYNYTFQSGDGVTPTRLNDARTISNIVDADIASAAAIAKTKISGTAITAADTGTVTSAMIASGVDASKLTTGTLPIERIADGAVTNAKIASGVDASKLTTGTLPADRIGSNAITTARINDFAVTAAKLDGAQTGSAPIYGCRAWVNFDGTTGGTFGGEFLCWIRASGNVSKVVRHAGGDYSVVFTTAMQDANYAISGSSGGAGGTSNGAVYSHDQLGAKTTTAVRIATLSSAGSPINTPHIMVMVIR